jgi:hypothetical protein
MDWKTQYCHHSISKLIYKLSFYQNPSSVLTLNSKDKNSQNNYEKREESWRNYTT